MLAVGRLAPRLERGDRRLGDDPVQLRDGEPPVDRDRARRRRRGSVIDRRIAGPARRRRKGAVGPGPRRRAQAAAGRHHLQEAAGRAGRARRGGRRPRASRPSRPARPVATRPGRPIGVQEDRRPCRPAPSPGATASRAGPQRRRRGSAAGRPASRSGANGRRRGGLAAEPPGGDDERLREARRRPLGERLRQDQADPRALGGRERLGLGAEPLEGIAARPPAGRSSAARRGPPSRGSARRAWTAPYGPSSSACTKARTSW